MKNILLAALVLMLAAGGYASAQNPGGPSRYHTRIVQLVGPNDTQLTVLGDQGWEVKGFSPCGVGSAPVGNGTPTLTVTCVILQQRY